MIPNVPGLDAIGYLTNETVMELTTVPKHLIVLGGGYIGLEFGQMFRRFGSRVTVVAKDAEILPREDADVAAELRKALEAEGMTFVLNAGTTGARALKQGVALSLKGPGVPRSVSGSHLLVATGRRPNTEALDLARAGVATDDLGFIKVNTRLETSAPGIWALGDVKGGPQFTHVSYNDYQVIWANLIEHRNVTIDDRLVPASVFTDPQLGRVGLTETEARKRGRPLKIGKIPMTWVARALERDETAGMMKLVVDAGTDRILGATTLCTEGGELIQTLRLAMRANLPYTALKGDIYIHPTLTEGFFTLMDQVK
jgi:pyruvate/2-oxoglutarate dehydrogenase complex dihydrolipoamide dehydrogenase (E3) component